jgi:hypothetical protein
MSTQNGTAINFGVSGKTFSGTGLGTFFLQNYSRQQNADMEVTRNEDGAEVNHTHYNFNDEASIEGTVKGTGLADAITQTKIPLAGAFITITDSSDSGLVGTTWEVQSGAALSGTNTTAKKIKVTMKKFAGITAAASA